jgi:hypothetical protein
VRATGYQPVVVPADVVMTHCSAAGFPSGYARRTVGQRPRGR